MCKNKQISAFLMATVECQEADDPECSIAKSVEAGEIFHRPGPL